MAFPDKTDDFFLLGEGKVLGVKPSFVDFVDIKKGEETNVNAGYAVSIDSATGHQIPYDGTLFSGVNVDGTTTMGTNVVIGANPELITMGYVTVVLATGTVQPTYGTGLKPNASGEFVIDNANAVCHATGQKTGTTASGKESTMVKIGGV